MAYKTIILKGDPVREEGLASGAITPGMLCEITNAAADTYKAHASAGGEHEKCFAIEDELQGNGIATAYSNGNQVLLGIFRPGEQVFALIEDGEDVSKGDKLESAGNGKLRILRADSSAIILESSVVAYAMEACDMSDSSSVDPSGRCRVRVA